MGALPIHELYARYIEGLSRSDRLRLLALIAEDLAIELGEDGPPHNIMEFAGVGASNPVGMDAQEYVNTSRDEWDHRQ